MPVVVWDKAHLLDVEMLEEVRFFSEFQDGFDPGGPNGIMRTAPSANELISNTSWFIWIVRKSHCISTAISNTLEFIGILGETSIGKLL